MQSLDRAANTHVLLFSILTVMSSCATPDLSYDEWRLADPALPGDTGQSGSLADAGSSGSTGSSGSSSGEAGRPEDSGSASGEDLSGRTGATGVTGGGSTGKPSPDGGGSGGPSGGHSGATGKDDASVVDGRSESGPTQFLQFLIDPTTSQPIGKYDLPKGSYPATFAPAPAWAPNGLLLRCDYLTPNTQITVTVSIGGKEVVSKTDWSVFVPIDPNGGIGTVTLSDAASCRYSG